MVACRALVRFPSAGGFDEDLVVNTWGFDLAETSETLADSVRDNLQAFYNAFGLHLADSVSWTLGEVRWYRMSDPEPRPPFHISALPVTSQVASTKIPREVALCVSFQGLPAAGIRQARRRGRLYIGPLSINAIGTADGMMAGAVVSAAAAAAQQLLTNSLSSPDWSWGVVSRFSPQIIVPINDGWVDNAPDIQRRRGVDATVKTTFGDPPPGFRMPFRGTLTSINDPDQQSSEA